MMWKWIKFSYRVWWALLTVQIINSVLTVVLVLIVLAVIGLVSYLAG